MLISAVIQTRYQLLQNLLIFLFNKNSQLQIKLLLRHSCRNTILISSTLYATQDRSGAAEHSRNPVSISHVIRSPFLSRYEACARMTSFLSKLEDDAINDQSLSAVDNGINCDRVTKNYPIV